VHADPAGVTMTIAVLSFGFKYASDIPSADLRIDLRRRIANPQDHLPKGAVGTDLAVRRSVLGPDTNRRVFQGCLDRVQKLLKDNASPVIAFGCNSGIHRSVVFAEELAERLRRDGHTVEVRHVHLRT
jgi:UPF0042 nucleotide-binding protein